MPAPGTRKKKHTRHAPPAWSPTPPNAVTVTLNWTTDNGGFPVNAPIAGTFTLPYIGSFGGPPATHFYSLPLPAVTGFIDFYIVGGLQTPPGTTYLFCEIAEDTGAPPGAQASGWGRATTHGTITGQYYRQVNRTPGPPVDAHTASAVITVTAPQPAGPPGARLVNLPAPQQIPSSADISPYWMPEDELPAATNDMWFATLNGSANDWHGGSQLNFGLRVTPSRPYFTNGLPPGHMLLHYADRDGDGDFSLPGNPGLGPQYLSGQAEWDALFIAAAEAAMPYGPPANANWSTIFVQAIGQTLENINSLPFGVTARVRPNGDGMWHYLAVQYDATGANPKPVWAGVGPGQSRTTDAIYPAFTDPAERFAETYADATGNYGSARIAAGTLSVTPQPLPTA